MSSGIPNPWSSFTASELQHAEFPEPTWAVPGIIAEGTTILAGRPKLGKSWLALGCALDVARGGRALGTRQVEQGSALVLPLEDRPRRLRDRLAVMMAPDEPWPGQLMFEPDWPLLDAEGVNLLSDRLEADPSIRFVVVDTLERARPPQRGNNAYKDDYAFVGAIQTLSQEAAVAILLVHHDRKGGADDYLDSVLGTTGVTGAADTVAVLARERGQLDAVLKVTGRDLPEDLELALAFDGGWWRELGAADDFRMDVERREVIDLFGTVDEVSPSMVAELLGITKEAARQRLSRMSRDGELHSPRRGIYTLPTPVTTVTSSHDVTT